MPENTIYNAIINPPNAINFWKKSDSLIGGYFDIGNANTEKYVLGDVRALKNLGDNYTIEMWIKPQYFGNPYIMSVLDGVKRQVIITDRRGDSDDLDNLDAFSDIPTKSVGGVDVSSDGSVTNLPYFSINIDENSIHIENDSTENHIPYTHGFV